MERYKRIYCRLTAAEMSRLKSVQKKTGRTMSRFLRDLVFHEIEILPSEQASEVAKLFLNEYSTIGKNINQVAKSLNIIAKNNYPLVLTEADKLTIEQLLQFMDMWRATLNAHNPIEILK